MRPLYDTNQLNAILDDAGICTVTLNNPTQLNALTTTMAEGANELADIISQSAARVVVFTGAGRAFSAGGDLDYLLHLTSLPANDSAAAMLRFYQSYLALFTLSLPTIAHINGPCVGAGFCLALACDLRFVVSGAKVGMNFVKIGLNPGMAAEFWATRESSPLVREMLLTGKIYSASEPRLAALFNQVASAEEISVAVAECARTIADASPQSIKISLPLLRNPSLSRDAVMHAEAEGQGRCMSVGEIAQAVAAQKQGKPFRFMR
ncbi:MAG: enoyl-CoA hydratase/isomerase family protein [Spirochaetes bacterium]|nr:enoyl-CoA hydratase/isomerase family protein [Spirochaetota bacterium]